MVSVIMLSVVMLGVVMLSVIMLSVIMLNVVAPRDDIPSLDRYETGLEERVFLVCYYYSI